MRKDFGKKTYYMPMPVVVIGTYDKNGEADAMTAAWTGIYDTNQVYICLSSDHKTVSNIVNDKSDLTLAFATTETVKEADFVGIISSNEVKNKLDMCGLSTIKSEKVNAPIINEFPLILECKVNKITTDESGDTTYFIADIINVSADESILDETGKIDPHKIHPVSYDPVIHEYRELTNFVGKAYTIGKVFEK